MGSSPPNKPPKQPRKVSRIFTFLKPTKREERQLEPSMPEQQTVDKSEHGNIATIVEAVLESNPSGSRDVTKMTGSPELGLLSQQSTGISVKAVVDDARDTSLLPSTNDEVEQPLRCLRPEEYTIGWLCPLEIEIRAALAMLDETHQSLKTQPSGDKNSYHLGRIGGHNVVIVRPYKTGNVSAAMTITSMRTTFTRVGDLLLVGIGGGVPSTPSSDSAFGRVRLGDVVVGTRDDKVPGAIQYDNGKAVDGKFVCTDYLRDPSERFQIALQHLALKREEALQAPRRSDPLQQNLQRLMAVHVQKRWRKKFGFPGRSKDLLFSSTSTHIELAPKQPICDKCDRGALIKQKYDDDEYDPHDVEVQDDYITVHRGIVASGGVIFKDAAQRDAMVKNLGVKNILCFDTEAAGAVMGLPGLVIRGISDYCDAHKPKEDVWHGYAAATAAAYARQLLLYTPAMSGEYIPKSFVETYQEDVANKDLSALYKWLDLPHPLNASNQHKFLREERVNGTGYHFLRNTQFTKWMDFGDVDWAERLLFCFGEPGAGKSFICSLVIDELHDRSDKPLIAYMYCNYRERRKQNIVAILGNLILQLLRACDDSSTDSVRHYMLEWHKLQRRKYVKLESMMFTDVLLVLWEVLTRTSKRVFFCVDALDECDHETQIGLLKALTTVVQASNVAIFVTSRPTLRQLVLNHFGVGRSLNFLQLRAAREDIELYVNVRIDADPLKGYNPRPMDDNLRMEILEKLVSNAEGIFLLPALQIASILEGVNIRQRRKLLKETSNTLTDTFTIMMERVKSQNPQLVALATQTLQWLTLGREILKVEDLQNALAIESGDTALDIQNITDIRIIVQSCLGLVVVDPVTTTVSLFHYSIQEFLQFTQETYFPDGDMHLAEMCLTFLNFPPFCKHTPESRLKELRSITRSISERFEGEPLLQYAAGNWGYHIGDKLNDKLVSLILKGPLFKPLSVPHEIDPSSAYREAFRAFDRRRGAMRIEGTPEPPLFPYNIAHIATYFGSPALLSAIVQYIPHAKVLFNARDGMRQTPFALAIWKGHANAVKFLLENGVDLDALEGGGHRAISTAISLRSEEVFRILVDSGKFDLNAALLSHSVQRGWEFAVRILLEHGVDPDVKDRSTGRTPLGDAAAALKAHLGIVQILVELGDKVDPDAKDRNGRTPLCNAVISQHVDVVEYLLDTGCVDVNSVGSDGLTVLMHSVLKEPGPHSTQITQLLLSAKADLRITDPDQRTALSYAAGVLFDSWTAVKMILDVGGDGIDIDAGDMLGRTPLSYAVERQAEFFFMLEDGGYHFETCVRASQNYKFDDEPGDLLVNSEASDNSDSDDGDHDNDGTSACSEDSEYLSTYCECMRGKTVLRRTFPPAEPRESVVKLLLDTGRVDPNKLDNSGRSPIAHAFSVLEDRWRRFRGDKEKVPVIRLLREAGAV